MTPTRSPLWSAPWQAAHASVRERRREATMWGCGGKLGEVGGRSRAPGAFYLQAGPAAHIDGREDTPPNELPPGSEGVCPPRPCEPMGPTTIANCFLALSTLSPPSPAEAEHVGTAQDSSQVSPDSHERVSQESSREFIHSPDYLLI